MYQILEKLKDDKNYYGEFGQQYLSNSDIITLLNDPKEFRRPKEVTKAMLMGRYFHTAMLEPDKLDSSEFIDIDVSSRNTKKYKEELLIQIKVLLCYLRKSLTLIMQYLL